MYNFQKLSETTSLTLSVAIIPLKIAFLKGTDSVARDLPGGKRIRIINMRAQHITFNKAIKTVLKDCKEF